jgi:hypothetical protein
MRPHTGQPDLIIKRSASTTAYNRKKKEKVICKKVAEMQKVKTVEGRKVRKKTHELPQKNRRTTLSVRPEKSLARYFDPVSLLSSIRWPKRGNMQRRKYQLMNIHSVSIPNLII